MNTNWNEILWKIVINKKVGELLNVISSKYPGDFTNDDYATTIMNFKQIISYSKATVKNKDATDNTEENFKKVRKTPEDELRCWARCWKMDDPNGYRCTMKKRGALYCKNHEKKLPHGKFGDALTPAQLSNFQKHGKPNKTEASIISIIKKPPICASNKTTNKTTNTINQNTSSEKTITIKESKINASSNIITLSGDLS